MNGRRLLPLLGLLLVLPVAAFAQEKADSPAEAGVYTPDNPPARLEIEGLLTDEDRTALRSRVGLANLGPEDAEVLADPEDSDICARLRRLVPRGYRTGSSQEFWQFTYFRVSDRYVITMELDIEPGQRPPVLTRQQTIVVNEDFEVVGTVLN